MNKFWNIMLKIVETIVATPLLLVGGILLTPIIVIVLLLDLFIGVFHDIWAGELTNE